MENETLNTIIVIGLIIIFVVVMAAIFMGLLPK